MDYGFAEFMDKLNLVEDLEQLQALQIDYFGSSGKFTYLLRSLGKMAPEERAVAGPRLNQLKSDASDALAERRKILSNEQKKLRLLTEVIDVTMPPRPHSFGSIHPVNFVLSEVRSILTALGFEYVDGHEIEDDFHNFQALNTPQHHPARQMQSTFYLTEGIEGRNVLRTHTSNTQIRTMMLREPPLSIMSTGRVFRRDFDSTHTPMFHQIEGLCVRESVSMVDMMDCIVSFIQAFFEKPDLDFRFRPSYFPFTEPSLEVDVKLGDSWLEILGCGMVHPKVLDNVGIDHNRYLGFAFGVGVERLIMLKYGIKDIRELYENNELWLRNYSFSHLHYLAL